MLPGAGAAVPRGRLRDYSKVDILGLRYKSVNFGGSQGAGVLPGAGRVWLSTTSPQNGSKSSLSIALMCTTCCRIPAIASANQGPETSDLILQGAGVLPGAGAAVPRSGLRDYGRLGDYPKVDMLGLWYKSVNFGRAGCGSAAWSWCSGTAKWPRPRARRRAKPARYGYG